MEQIKFRSMDELEIFGHLSIPHSTKPLPAVLLVTGGIHGGVFQEDGAYDPLHIEICNCLNNAGYATLIVDKRGSKGYGNEYMSYLDLCGREVDDIIAGGLYLKGLSQLNGRIAVHGTSRSSTTASLAISRSSIFAAAVLASGFYDIYPQYKYEEKYRSQIFPTKQSMQGKDIETFPYRERSPINHVGNVNCSVLLVHGKDDTIVPLERSVEYHNTLRRNCVDVELIIYEQFAHFKAYSYPSHPIGRTYWDECIRFLHKHLK
ncbi:MAG: prolyl oligopeptidase family serine peptidase [Nanoarchaeota archaeon]|nr:prolyl oligopeptidase family serine peptidase [Nanoarchaeota archaeon]